MKKASIPAPPQPSFHFSAAHSPAMQPGESGTSFSSTSRKTLPVPLDSEFLHRVTHTSWWVGAVFAFVVYAVTKSAFLAWSFAAGEALSIVMLYSQQAFVGRLASALASTRESVAEPQPKKRVRFPAWTFLPAKYLLLGALIGGLLHFDLIQPFAFVMGVPLVQVVITAKVMGRMMTQNRTSIREAYVEKGKPNAV